MRIFSAVLIFAIIAAVYAQANFGGSNEPNTKTSTSDQIDGVGNRGLLATELNLHPTADGSKANSASGRQTQGGFCCCASISSACPSSSGGSNGGGGSFIDGINPRDSANSGTTQDDPRTPQDIVTRIVNDPVNDSQQDRCPSRTRQCCYSTRVSRDQVRNRCTPINNNGGGSSSGERWEQGCSDRRVRRGRPQGDQCGERFPITPQKPLGRGQAKPYEFPWTCLVLKGNNDFLGTCAIIPNNFNNDISRGTDRVITAAHKLKNVGRNDLIKVRIIEYDASGFNNPETESHQEFVVKAFRNHPQYQERRLSHDVALLFLNQTISLRNNRNVNAACLPKCNNMFNYQFNNGTGTRCWVAGWGKDKPTGSFQFIQNKVDVPLYERGRCQTALRGALERKRTPNARDFLLSDSEICAGGEQGKDACEGDGGAPLVCQSSENQRWYVVGLVTWGVGCADRNVPGVYANIFDMLPFILGRL